MFRKKNNVCYEPDKGSLWEWGLILTLFLMLCPVAWVLRLFVDKQRAYDMAFTPIDKLGF